MDDKFLKVNEIFVSIDGEGKRVGQPVVFIRLFGCNLRCKYCDTEYANGSNLAERYDMSISDIVEKVMTEQPQIKKITLTGGEPLYQKHTSDLILELLHWGYEVNVETNGSVDLQPFYMNGEFVRYRHLGKLFFTMDWKCAFSGMQKKMKKDNFDYLTDNDIVKFVVATRQEMEDAKGLFNCSNCEATPYFSPVFGEIEPKEIADFIINDMPEAVMQIQLHKIIWDPEQRGV